MDPAARNNRPDSTAAAPVAEPGPPDPLLRAAQLFLAGVIGMAFVGFFVGIRQGAPPPEPKPVVHETPEIQTDAIPATSYRDFDRRRLGPNRAWKSTFTSLAQPAIDLFARPERTDEGRRAALDKRASRRAFDGAPPVVPHPIDQRTTASCLVCHGDGVAIGTASAGPIWAPKMSHGVLANCTQCHVEQQAAELEAMPMPPNHFAGRPAPLGGRRAWTGAPPTVPHTVFMRESCLSCHGPSGSEPIRTTHAWRTNCLQCHAPSAVLDQISPDDRAPWSTGENPASSVPEPKSQP